VSNPITRLNAALDGRYRIERELGEGGMAIVYLAEDLRHGRSVALKVLKPELAAIVGAERFLAEIKTTANLQHPHILPLFDSGHADGFLYYVMPYVEGETLREKLSREGELPVHLTVRILRDLVDALAYAHGRGVVHRDVKPGNVMVSGRHASVMDFGVAKAVGASADPNRETTAGVALGTPVYMAPEQAAADPHVDHRADIYAVGVVAYELLAGVPPISGRSPREVLAGHVTQTPVPLRERRESVPPRLEEAVMRCLEKRAADRWQSADQLLDVLEEALTPSLGTTPTSTQPTARPAWSKRAIAAAGVLGLSVIGLLAWSPTFLTSRSAAPIEVSSTQRLTSDMGLEIHPAVSPDGRFVVYAAGTAASTRLFLRTVDGGRTIPLTDDSTAIEEQPRWSSDGDRILFLSRGRAMVVSALGGAATRVAGPTDGVPVSAATWSPAGDEIAVVRGGTLSVVELEGGSERMVLEAPTMLSDCSWSPVTPHLACVNGNRTYSSPGYLFGNLAPSAIVSVGLRDGTLQELAPPDATNQSPVWSGDGHTIYFVSNRHGTPDVYAQRVGGGGVPDGDPQRITVGSHVHSFSLSADASRMAYSVYTAQANLWTMPIPDEGDAIGLADARQLTFGNQVVEAGRPSPDGAWIVYDSDVAGTSDIWRVPTGGGAPEQLTDDPMSEFAPDVSPDGRELAYHGWMGESRELFVRTLETGSVLQLTDDPSRQESYPRWAPDGSAIVYFDQATATIGGWIIRRDSEGQWGHPERLDGTFGIMTWSPDGRRLAHRSLDRSGLMVHDLASGGNTVVHRVREGERAGEAHWSPDGRRIYFKVLDADLRAEIRVVPADGLEARVVVRFDDPRRLSIRSDLFGDAESFYFTLEDRESDVWLAETTRR
jgi:eukaryotic-like serine/threonine-protein kinase